MYNNHTQFSQTRKVRSPQAFEPIATKKNAETLAQCPANAPQKSRSERIAALDKLMSDFDRKADWVSGELHQALRRGKRVWSINFLPYQRAELERILVHLRARDPVLRRAIIADLIEWHGANDHILSIWFRLPEGGDHD